MGLRLMKFDNQDFSESILVAASQTIYEGTPCVIRKDGTTLKRTLEVYDDTDRSSSYKICGLAVESNQIPASANLTGPTVGEGYDYGKYNRGAGYMSLIRNNAMVEIFGNDLVEEAGSFVIGKLVYWYPTSLFFTDDSTNAVQVGILEDYTKNADGEFTRIVVRLTLAY